MVGMYDNTLSNRANLTPQCGLAYCAMHAAKQEVGGMLSDGVKIVEFRRECGRAKCFFSQSSKPNELIFNTMFYNSVCLKGPQ